MLFKWLPVKTLKKFRNSLNILNAAQDLVISSDFVALTAKLLTLFFVGLALISNFDNVSITNVMILRKIVLEIRQS